MENMNFFDLAVSAIVILLALKGFFNGLFKEVFGLIGIVGGVYVGSHYAVEVGKYLNTEFFHLQNDTAIEFTGFLVALIVFWIGMSFIGTIFTKISSSSGLGIVNRILGAIFGGGKIFLIFAIIAYAFSNIQMAKSKIEEWKQHSILLPVMIQAGSYILKFEVPDEVKNSVDEAIEKTSNSVKETVQDVVEEEVKNVINNKVDEITTQTTNEEDSVELELEETKHELQH